MADTTRAQFNVQSVLTLILIVAWIAAIGYGIVTGALDYKTALATLSGPVGVAVGYWFAGSRSTASGA